jgi:hypothetical protein
VGKPAELRLQVLGYILGRETRSGQDVADCQVGCAIVFENSRGCSVVVGAVENKNWKVLKFIILLSCQ